MFAIRSRLFALGPASLVVLVGCNNGPSAGADADTSTGASSVGQTEESGGSESEGTGGEEWPACVEGEDLRVGAIVQSDDWPWTVPPVVEHGTCSIDALDEVPVDGGTKLWMRMTCSHSEGGEYALSWGLGDPVALAGRVEQFVGLEGLAVDFEQYWPFDVRHDNITVRDGEGTLLLAGVVEEPQPSVDGWEGLPVGAPDSVAQPTWFAPFDAFVLRDDLCPVEDSAFTGYPLGTARRMGVEVAVADQELLIMDDTQEVGVVTSAGSYDLLVSSAWRLIEPACEDCPPVFVSFLIIRTG